MAAKIPARILSKFEVIELIKAYVAHYETAREAAESMGCTSAQLSNALADRGTVSPRILDAIGVERKPVYIVGYEDRFADGSTVL